MGHLLKIQCVDSRVNVHILASTSVPFTLTAVQVPNLALTHTKRIAVLIFPFEGEIFFASYMAGKGAASLKYVN